MWRGVIYPSWHWTHLLIGQEEASPNPLNPCPQEPLQAFSRTQGSSPPSYGPTEVLPSPSGFSPQLGDCSSAP